MGLESESIESLIFTQGWDRSDVTGSQLLQLGAQEWEALLTSSRGSSAVIYRGACIVLRRFRAPLFRASLVLNVP